MPARASAFVGLLPLPFVIINTCLSYLSSYIFIHQQTKREYRRAVAIPRYLAKRKRRQWNKEPTYSTRTTAAHRRPRSNGERWGVGWWGVVVGGGEANARIGERRCPFEHAFRMHTRVPSPLHHPTTTSP